jgi:hypothetical protein
MYYQVYVDEKDSRHLRRSQRAQVLGLGLRKETEQRDLQVNGVPAAGCLRNQDIAV